MIRNEIHTDDAPAAIGPYSQAVLVGNMLYTSGSMALTPEGTLVEGGISEQTHQVFRNLQAILSAAGSSFRQVVKATCYLKDMNDFKAFNEVYASYFPDQKPARTTVEVARLPMDVLVEIDLIAYVD